jgi:hypothetical protein
MKKLLFSILIVLGLFLVGCGKDNKDDGKESTLSVEDKSRPRIELQDVSFDGKTIKQIVVIPADEAEENKLFEEAMQSQENFNKVFSFLTEKQANDGFNMIKGQIERNFVRQSDKSAINLENSYNNFIETNQELRKYMSEKDINDLKEFLKNKSVGTADIKIENFNDFLKLEVKY